MRRLRYFRDTYLPFLLCHEAEHGNRTVKQRGIAKRDLGLDFSRRGVPDAVIAAGRASGSTHDEMVDLAHGTTLRFRLPFLLRPKKFADNRYSCG